ASIPSEQLLRPGKRRFLMRRALSGIVPKEILERRSKVSAMRCYSLALQKHWNKVKEALEHPIASDLLYFEADKLKLDLIAVRNGHCPFHLVRLLKALSLELWLKDVISRGIVAAPDRSIVQSLTAATSEFAQKD